jgi:hypothetical protein
MKIKTKAESVRFYEQGFFGNKGLTWETVADYLKSGYAGPVVLRYRDPGQGGGPCFYDLGDEYEVLQAVRYSEKRGYKVKHMWINAQMPDYAIEIQGEYWVGQDCSPVPEDLFRCSTEKVQMRPALTNVHQHVGRGVATEILKRKMTPKGWANFEWLRESFPGHIIEVSVYNEPVGLQRWNSVVWEVRSY